MGMIGNLVKANRINLCNIFRQSEKWLSCQLCERSNIFLPKRSFHYSSITKPLLLPCLSAFHTKRHIGDYDKLWQSVNSGRGKGRSLKKKVKPKTIDGEFLKFNTANMTWPGLNAPVMKSNQDASQKLPRESGSRPSWPKHERGWAGTTWPGRHAGVPEALNGEPVDGFDSIVIEVTKVSAMKASGRHKRTRAIVVVGNKNGAIGWSMGRATFAYAAIRKARNKAVNYLHHIPLCDGHTIYHDLRHKIKNTTINFERKVPGYGRRCQRIVRAICELAGIEDIRCKLIGRTTPLTVVRCAFQGLEMQETHQELADRLGKHVVEYRRERGNLPVVVATPSLRAVKRRAEQEKEGKEEDITLAFDPFHGAHRPKSLEDIQGEHPDILADM